MPSQAPRRRRASGARMTTKQIVQTVKDGRLVTCSTTVGEVTGYVCGMDDYHWMIVSRTGQVSLVHKSAALVHLHPEGTYAGEPDRETLDGVVGPFRKFVMSTYFNLSATTEE